MGRFSSRSTASARVLPILFTVSGFSSLLLEVTWARQLTQIIGSGVRAGGAVTSLMLAGLALGAYRAGLRSDSLRRPVRAYALLEACIGVWAILTPLLYTLLARAVPLLRTTGNEAEWTLVSLLASALLVLPGALMMGATTPLVVRADFLLAGGEASKGFGGRRLGRLYAWNTLGGAAGSLSAAFWILPALGMKGACLLAGILDLALAGTALALRWKPASSRADAAQPDAGASLGKAGWSLRSVLPAGALLGAGALAAAAQVAWTRLLILFFGSSVQALGLTLTACLAGLAVGAGLSSRGLARGWSGYQLAEVFSGIGAGLILLTLPMWGKLPVLASVAQANLGGAFAGAITLQALLCALLILPSAAAFGALLPSLTAPLEKRQGAAAKVSGTGYALDSAGSIVGALGSTFVLLPRWGVESMLRSILLASLVLCASLALARPLGTRRLRLPALCGLMALGAFLLPSWDPVLVTSGPLLYSSAYARSGGRSWKGIEDSMRRRGAILFMDEGADATVTVRLTPSGNRSLQINGKTDASDGGDLPAQILAGQLPALVGAEASRALLIGLASGTTAGSLATHSLGRIDCVEICPGVVRAARLFQEANHGVLSDERLRLRVGDGRAILQSSSEVFDLIVSQPTNPWIAGVTNLFTREFFRSARDHLSSAGILAVWVQGYSMDPEDFRSVVGTFQEVFPRAQLWEESAGGGDYFLLGTRGGAKASLETILARMSGPVRADLQRAGITDAADLLSRFIASDSSLKRYAQGAPRITDDNVRLEYSAPKEIWRNRLPDLLASLEAVRQPPEAIFPEIRSPARQSLRDLLAERERTRRERIRHARSLSPGDLEALGSPALQAALNSIRDGEPERAALFLQQARREVPYAPVVPLLSGWMALSGGQPEAAEAAFSSALALDSTSSEALQGLGLSLYRQGKLDAAAISLRKSVALEPRDAEATGNLGAVLLAQGYEVEALQWLDASVALDPRLASARINRGVALARLGRAAEAIREYEIALHIDPGNEDALFNLRQAEQRLGDTPSSP